MTYLDPKYSDEIQSKIVTWLNDNLDDPYEQVTSKMRDNFVYGGDYEINMAMVMPRINVTIEDFKPNKVATQSKTAYLEEEEHNFMIYYTNNKIHRYTFGNAQTLIGEAQCRRYLQYIKNKIKGNATFLDEYCNKITFGTIPKPVYNPKNNVWVSVLPMTVFTYRR